MKRLFLFVILSVLGMTACNNADIMENAGDNTTVVSISASIPAKMNQTRAAGEGANVNRCIMEVYLDGELYGERAYAEVNDCKANFSVRLVSGKSYDFVFWADHVDDNSSDEAIKEDLHYNTTDLSNVTIADMTAYQGSDDTRDAFFGTATVEADYTKTLAVNLTRPFGQVKVKTLDMNDVPDDMRPTHVSVEFESVPTGIDLFRGELTSAASGITYTGAAALAATAEKEDGLLSFDYIFAPMAEGEQHLVNFTMQFLDDNNVSVAPDYEFSNIPVQRNYRTIVSGYLLTKKADINVSVVPGFDGEINSDEIEITASELQGVLSALDTEGEHDYNIHVTDNLTAGSYTLPALADGSTLAIDLAGAEGEVTFGNDSFAGLLELGSTSADAIEININVPNGDAALNSGTWAVNSVSTKPTTFTVNEGATVTTLNVAAGNVVINKGAEVASVARTANNQDETTTVTLFDGAEEPTITDPEIMVQEGVSGQITIGEKSFATIAAALAAAEPYDVIELAEGEYALNHDILSEAHGQKFYLPIEVEGLTIRGKGAAANTVIYGKEYTDNGSWGTQNTITVFAANVTLENLTLMPKQETNKLVEISAEGFKMINCIVTANNKVADADPNDAASIYFSGVSNGVVSGCTINKGNICFDGVMDGVFTIENNTFNGYNQWGDTKYATFTCSYWGQGKDLSKSTMMVNIKNNTFNDVTPLGENNDVPVVRASYGIFNLEGNKFPTDGIYWTSAPGSGIDNSFGAVYVNYNSPVSQLWTKDRTEPKSFAISNDKIEFETMTEPNNNWYSWQGRKAAVDMPAKSSWEVSSTLTLTGENRAVNKSIWLNIGIDWPIVLFKQAEDGTRKWQYWDSSESGAWLDVPADKNISTEAGDYEITIAFDNGTITHSINGVEVASYTLDETVTAVKEIIFNSYSFGESYKTTWSYPVVK